MVRYFIQSDRTRAVFMNNLKNRTKIEGDESAVMVTGSSTKGRGNWVNSVVYGIKYGHSQFVRKRLTEHFFVVFSAGLMSKQVVDTLGIVSNPLPTTSDGRGLRINGLQIKKTGFCTARGNEIGTEKNWLLLISSKILKVFLNWYELIMISLWKEKWQLVSLWRTDGCISSLSFAVVSGLFKSRGSFSHQEEHSHIAHPDIQFHFWYLDAWLCAANQPLPDTVFLRIEKKIHGDSKYHDRN